MAAWELQVGQVVCSKTGRDKNKFYLVWQIIDDKNVFIIDGHLRKVGRPKKKNIKHLEPKAEIAQKIAEKINRKEPVADSEVQMALKELGFFKN